jgi:Rieske 2Fe-2S family protein
MSAELIPTPSLADELARTRRPFAEARTLPGSVYRTNEVLQLEMRGIFAREWLCAGREADIPQPGDYFLRDVAGNPIIVMRGADGVVRAFYNVCRHRGSKLLEAPSGSGLSRILCPYHAWSYHLDGRLHTAPQMNDTACKDDLGLVSVRTGSWHGFVFLNLDASAPPLERWLGDMPNLTRYRMAELVLGKCIEYDVAANWKLICENYSECYHCPGAHPQLHRLTESIGRNERDMEIGACFNGGPMRLRDGVETMSSSGRRSLPTIPGLTHEDSRYVNYYVVYPNMLLSPHPDYVLVHTLWPQALDRTHVICEWLVSREAAASGADASDVVDFWDKTNRQDWILCERAQLGVVTLGYRQGPYQPSEDCVHTFDRWYADRLAALL